MSLNEKKRVCLIGLGKITARYCAGLASSPRLSLCAVSDINEEAFGRSYYEGYPFYTNYQAMIEEQKPDFAIISVFPSLHFEIAEHCLKRGVNVIIEKPVTLTLKEFDALTALAREKGLVFRTLFHWHGGIETQAFTEGYDRKDIEEIRVSVQDPYCPDGEIIEPDRRSLMGAWIDSGVNILSMLHLWLPFEQLEILNVTSQACKETGMPVFVSVELLIDGVKTAISVDWRKGLDRKESWVTVKGRVVHIQHSEQSITDGETVAYGRMPRLDEHYCSLFRAFDGSSNVEFSRAVHEFLFKVDQRI